MFPNISTLLGVAVCYFVFLDCTEASECAKIDLSSTKSRTATCDANAQKLNGDFFFVCVAEDQPSNFMADVSSTCRNMQVSLQKTLKVSEKSLSGSVVILMNKEISVRGKSQFVARTVGPERDVWQGLQIAHQALSGRAVDHKIAVVVSYVNASPCLLEAKCKEFVEKMHKDKFDVYFVNIEEKSPHKPLNEKHFVYDSSLLAKRAEGLPIFEQYAANCICEQLFGAASPSVPSSGDVVNNPEAANSPKSLSTAVVAPKKFTVGKILMIVLPVVGLIVVVAIIAIVLYVKKRKATTKQLENKSKSSVQ
uniref:Uncharacterized protein n=1 Tax=Romanomermis culicivorax TaxID=13658 RepID=A0A915J7R7_ROMCU